MFLICVLETRATVRVATLNNIKRALLACNGNKMDLYLILVSFLYESLIPLSFDFGIVSLRKLNTAFNPHFERKKSGTCND